MILIQFAARSMLAPEEITDKLVRRIKELEGKVKPTTSKNKENMPNFNELLEQAAEPKVGSKRKLSHSESVRNDKFYRKYQ